MTGRRVPRYARITATAVVAVIAAYASYRHMVNLGQRYGQPADIAYLLPLSVDGMMVVASLTMVTEGRVRGSAVAAFLVGIGASLWANALAADPNWVARVISTWPAVALVLVVELLVRRTQWTRADELPEGAGTGAGQLPELPELPEQAGSRAVSGRLTDEQLWEQVGEELLQIRRRAGRPIGRGRVVALVPGLGSRRADELKDKVNVLAVSNGHAAEEG